MTTQAMPIPLGIQIAIAKDGVVNAAIMFGRCAEEFDGDLATCGEYIDALWTATDKYEKLLEVQKCQTIKQ